MPGLHLSSSCVSLCSRENIPVYPVMCVKNLLRPKWKTSDISHSYRTCSLSGEVKLYQPFWEGYLEGISLGDNIITWAKPPNKRLYWKLCRKTENEFINKGWIMKRQKKKAKGAPICNTHVVFNYLVVWCLMWELCILNWEMITVGFKTRKGFLDFWSNTSEYLFPWENHTTTFKDSFPSMCYSLYNCQYGQQCYNTTLLVLFYSWLTYCSSKPIHTRVICI